MRGYHGRHLCGSNMVEQHIHRQMHDSCINIFHVLLVTLGLDGEILVPDMSCFYRP